MPLNNNMSLTHDSLTPTPTMLFYRNMYTKTKKDTKEMKPGTLLQPEEKGIPLTMRHFVLAEKTHIHQMNRFKVLSTYNH